MSENKPKEEQSTISIEQFNALEIVVGEICSAERVPDTDKLIKFSVDLGEDEPRQIISGIAEFFPDTDLLVGKKCVFVANLKPRILRGLESNGMILAASTKDGSFALMIPETDIPPGTRIG